MTIRTFKCTSCGDLKKEFEETPCVLMVDEGGRGIHHPPDQCVFSKDKRDVDWKELKAEE